MLASPTSRTRRLPVLLLLLLLLLVVVPGLLPPTLLAMKVRKAVLTSSDSVFVVPAAGMSTTST